jgi:hypothetical protein
MPFVAVPSTIKVELFQRLHGQNIENVLWFRNFSGWDAESAAGFLADLVEWWGSEIAPFVTDDLTLVGTKATDMSEETGFAVEYQPTAPVPGLLAGESVPANCALVISFRSPFRGRSSRGRNYVAGIAEGDVVNSAVINGIGESLRQGYGQLQTVAAAVGAQHVVASLFFQGAPRPVGATFPVTAYVLTDTVIDSQRRRLPGRGA